MAQSNQIIVAVPYFQDGEFKVANLGTMKDITIDFQKGQGGGGRKYDDPRFRQEVLGWHSSRGNWLRGIVDKKSGATTFAALKTVSTSEGIINKDTLAKFQKAFPKGQIGKFIIENMTNGIIELKERKKKLAEKKVKPEKNTKKATVRTGSKQASRKSIKKTVSRKALKK